MAGGRLFEALARQLPARPRIAILETPAGFEPNSAQVAGRVADFLRTRLANYQPHIDVVPARKRGGAFSPDDPEICAPLLHADLIFMGPGSPTYAIRQLHGTLAWQLLRARHRLGAALVFASAATIAIGQHALPVYEIYKVGQDVQAVPGLDLFSELGANLSLVPHWNNSDGGDSLDTSRCFVGADRFGEWYAQLPAGHTVLGLDEHTGLLLDVQAAQASVMGVSTVTILRNGHAEIFPAGSGFALAQLGTFGEPANPEAGIPAQVWEMATRHAEAPHPQAAQPPEEVQQLAQARQQARAAKDWLASDDLRRQINALGWAVQDTPEGYTLSRG